MSARWKSNATPLFAFVVISLAVVGYFTGLQSPMTASRSNSPSAVRPHVEREFATEDNVIPATDYANMAEAIASSSGHTRVDDLQSSVDPLAEIQIRAEDKQLALSQREQNRAFNGAPPTIPHPIDQRSDASCMSCHGDGARTVSLRIPRMSHDLLTNCTQCHVEHDPRHMSAIVFRRNGFEGLPAPTAGPRAFEGAPPQIPHSTWMRTNCLSCHGTAGLHGLRTTHPWRNNCQQCHTPSALMEQTPLPAQPRFLPGPKIEN